MGQTPQWPHRNITSIGVWLGHYVRKEQPRGDVILRIRETPEGSILRERHLTNPVPLNEWIRANNIHAILWRSSDITFADITANPEDYPILFETSGKGIDGEPHIVRLHGVPASK